MKDHPNGEIEINLIKDGYPLHLKDRDPSKLCKSVSNIVRDKKELKEMLTRMVKEAKKAYITTTHKQLHYNLNLLCVPKRNNETHLMTEIRVARHGSFATRRSISINDLIMKENCKMPTLPNLRKYIELLLKFDYVSLRDLKDAFRQLNLASCDAEYIQYCIFGLSFRDLRQAYGIASAAANCQHFAQILIWILEHKFLNGNQKDRILVHIDDFILAANSESEALALAVKFDDMCCQLNIAVSHDKDENGICIGVVHGTGFNLKTKHVHIPAHKFDDLVRGLSLMIQYRYATGRALESICGKMMHWSQLRKPAKVLCYRLLRLIHKEIRSNPKLKNKILWIPDPIIIDLKFWLQYANYMRKVTMHSVIHQPSITITGATDASNIGGGFVVGSYYGAYEFNDEQNMYGINHRRMSINYQEAHAVITLLYNYRHILSGRQLLLYIDNKSVLFSIYKHWAGSEKLMEYIHEIVLLMCVFSIGLRVEFIPSSFNDLADSLSRFDWKRFYDTIDAFNLQMNDTQTQIEYYPTLRLLRKYDL